MKKEQLLERLNNFMDEYNIGRSDFVIGTGAALVLYGLIETTSDIDIEMSEELIDGLFPSDWHKRCPMMAPFAPWRIELPNKVYVKPSLGSFTSKTVKTVDGIQCRSIESLKKIKETLVEVRGEERDRVDLENISNYLKGMSKARKVLNLTQHQASAEQIADGVIEPAEKAAVRELLTFDTLPCREEILRRARELAIIASHGEYAGAMLGGPPYLMKDLETALHAAGVPPMHAFSIKVTVRVDGNEISVFKHAGFIPA